ncbi:hypothetical protein [uncultured Sutterella sp.]|uniref:hypothetical protein n=1 Tax=uncultured Sutterella sp. TaxID=286133 RepID=UPI0025FDCC71|nr:hypothetical protein [uncultured Sutterella sp.]
MRVNAPGTADAPENLSGGVLIVMPPGFGPEVDESTLPAGGEARAAALERITRARGVVTAARVDRGECIPQALRWLAAAGFPVQKSAKRFSIFTWPEHWDGRPRDRHVVRDAVREGGRLAEELLRRRPLLVLFLSSQLLDAANDPEMIGRLAPALGRPLEPAFRLSSGRLRILGQRWERTLMAGVPLPRRTHRADLNDEVARALRLLFEREELL